MHGVAPRTLPLLLPLALGVGCAARYVEPGADAPHAIVSFPSQEAQVDSRLFLEPVEFNGMPRPRRWLRETFRVPPGELRLLVRAAREDRQGECLLVFPISGGEVYHVGAHEGADVFEFRAMHAGSEVAECTAGQTLLPTPSGIRGIIPREWSARPRE